MHSDVRGPKKLRIEIVLEKAASFFFNFKKFLLIGFEERERHQFVVPLLCIPWLTLVRPLGARPAAVAHQLQAAEPPARAV